MFFRLFNKFKMATCSKQLFLTLFNSTNKNNVVLVRLGNNFRSHLSVAHCSVSEQPPPKQKLSKAIKSYLEKASQYNNFLKEQLNEYNMGKKFLATMMGKKGEMTQKDIDEAIEYLFPCGLFVPKSRPVMKPPEEIFAKQKPVQFDSTGRPFHFLFYTVKPNYSQCLHDAAVHFMRLNNHEEKMRKSAESAPGKKLVLVGDWMSKKELEQKFNENLYSFEYIKFIDVFNRLAQHPYASLAEDFIKEYWVAIVAEAESEIPKPETLEDGTQTLTVLSAKRKTTSADVTVTYPGKGRIRINGIGLDYFLDIPSREQVIFPLIFTEMQNKVDVEATVDEKGGESSRAGAVRLGISKALQGFVSPEMRLKMKLAGLLHRDMRRRERKKPGKDGARRRYTWLKR